MLTVFEAAAGEDDREVAVVVDVGISHVAAIEHHGVIEEGSVGLLDVLEILKEVSEQFHLMGNISDLLEGC